MNKARRSSMFRKKKKYSKKKTNYLSGTNSNLPQSTTRPTKRRLMSVEVRLRELPSKAKLTKILRIQGTLRVEVIFPQSRHALKWLVTSQREETSTKSMIWMLNCFWLTWNSLRRTPKKTLHLRTRSSNSTTQDSTKESEEKNS